MASILAGALALIILEALGSTKSASTAVGGGFAILNGVVRWIVDPSVPGIPDLRAKASSGSSSSGAGSGLTKPTTPGAPIAPPSSPTNPSKPPGTIAGL